MTRAARGPVVIDTGVFASRLTRSGKVLEAAYRPLLEGRMAALSFVTVGELRFGALHAGWGARRQTRLNYELSRVRIVWSALT
jgi:predicted nucleic acid-binding protein